MKCHKCQTEWANPSGVPVILQVCPFCGADLRPEGAEKPDSMESVLKTIIDHCGLNALKDGRRTLAMVSDLAPDLKKEKTMFGFLVQVDGNRLLLDALASSRSEQLTLRGRITQEMMDAFLISEAVARTAFDGFWAAIGGQAFETAPPPKPEPKPAPAPKPQPKPAPAPLFSRDQYEALLPRIGNRIIACGYHFIAALDVKGRVHVTKAWPETVRGAEQWQNIVAVAAGFAHVVGLKANGTVCAAGHNLQSQCDVRKWTRIIDIAAGMKFTIGLRPDGTVVYTGETEWLSQLSRWKNIVSIAAGRDHAVGLKADGTVAVAGGNKYAQCNISHWTHIARIYAFDPCTFGVRQDGSPVSTDSRFELTHWSDPLHISVGSSHAVGLTRSGQVLECHYGNEDKACTHITHWQDVLTLCAHHDYTVGMKADGTLVFAGNGNYDLNGWKLFDSLDELDAWLTAAEQRKRTALNIEIAHLRRELLRRERAVLHGLFAGKRRSEIEEKRAFIRAQLNAMKH